VAAHVWACHHYKGIYCLPRYFAALWQTRGKYFFLVLQFYHAFTATFFAHLPRPFATPVSANIDTNTNQLIFNRDLIRMFTATFAAHISASLASQLSANSM
jgi:hypothetical protein